MTSGTPAKISVDTAVATSSADSTEEAVTEAINTAKQSLNCEPEFAIILTTVDRSVEDIQASLRDSLPETCGVHAATSCGATLSNAGPTSKGVSVLLMGNTQGAVSVSSKQYDSESESLESFAAALGTEAASKLDGEAGNFLLFSSPGMEEGMLRGLCGEFPGVAVFGGSAADNTVEGNWRVYNADTSFGSGASLIALSSTVDFHATLVPPYERGQQAAEITKCSGRVINELNGRKAIDVINEWLPDDRFSNGGNIIMESATFPLGVEAKSGGFVALHAAEVMNDGSVGLFAEVTEGDVLLAMKGMNGTESNPVEYAKVGLETAYQSACENLAGAPKSGVLIYCGGLSIAVGDGLADSLKGMQNKVPVLGMTAFGEQGCLLGGDNVHSNLAVGVGLFG